MARLFTPFRVEGVGDEYPKGHYSSWGTPPPSPQKSFRVRVRGGIPGSVTNRYSHSTAINPTNLNKFQIKYSNFSD